MEQTVRLQLFWPMAVVAGALEEMDVAEVLHIMMGEMEVPVVGRVERCHKKRGWEEQALMDKVMLEEMHQKTDHHWVVVVGVEQVKQVKVELGLLQEMVELELMYGEIIMVEVAVREDRMMDARWAALVELVEVEMVAILPRATLVIKGKMD